MGNLQDAADHIHALASKYEPLVRVSQLLKEVGAIDGHLIELEAKRTLALEAIEQLRRDHADTVITLHAELEALEAQVVASNEQAMRLEASTNQRIQEMFAAGEAEAVAKAEAVYREKTQEIGFLEMQSVSEVSKLAGLKLEVAALEGEKSRISEETTAAHAGLAEVLKTIEQLSKFGQTA
jgi:tRNA A37 N6-isopentenylltransferase MiaA